MERCCVHCFNDEYLKEYIKDNGSPGKCDFCGRRTHYCIEPSELLDLFMPVISLYSIWEDFMPLHDLKNRDGDFIWEKLHKDWDVFSFWDYSKQENLIRSMFGDSYRYDGDEDSIVNSWVDREDEYFGTDFEYSDSLKKMWDEFCNEIMHKNRFFPQKDMKPEFLTELLPIVSTEIGSQMGSGRENQLKVLHIGEKACPYLALRSYF